MKTLKNQKILICGAGGSIGSELARQIYRFNHEIYLLDNNETALFELNQELPDTIPILADIRDLQELDKIFQNNKPDIVFHCAAYKHVPMLEKYPEEAMKNNVMGTQNVGFTAIKNKVKKFIFISTDKAVEPSSIMGKTKAIGEAMCQKMNQNSKTKFIIVRFGNVLASRGSVIPIFWRQIEREESLTITDEKMERYSMTIFEACQLILEATQMGKGGEVYVFDMGKPIKIKELAEQMVRLSGKDLSVKIIGIRPGEKLSEKLYGSDEKIVKTNNPKIWQIIKKK